MNKKVETNTKKIEDVKKNSPAKESQFKKKKKS